MNELLQNIFVLSGYSRNTDFRIRTIGVTCSKWMKEDTMVFITSNPLIIVNMTSWGQITADIIKLE